MEVAALGLKVDGVEGIERATGALDRLSDASKNAESSGDRLSDAFRGFSAGQAGMLSALRSINSILAQVAINTQKTGLESRKSTSDVDIFSSTANKAAAAAQALSASLESAANQAARSGKDLSDYVKSMRESVQPQQQSRTAGETLIAMLREQIATVGKSSDELLRYRAAQAGVAAQASPLILQLQNQRAAQIAASEAARQEESAQRAAAAVKQRNEAFIQGLKDQAATQNMSTAEMMRYRAAQLGVSAEAEQYIRAISRKADALKQEQTQSAAAANSMKELAAANNSLSANIGMAVRGVQTLLAMQIVGWAKDSAMALYQASAAAERLRISLDFSSTVGSAAEIAYLRKTTYDLGLAFDSTAKAYQQFSAAARGTALEGEKARSIFESVAKASAVMGLSADQTGGVLLALQQMISKGAVQSEELRGQLGERLPGAFQTAARAMGVTTAELGKMLEQGQVVADDFLPKFAQELNRSLGDAAEKAANRLDSAVNRFNAAWEKLKQTAGDSGVSQALAKEMSAIGRDMTAISDAIENASKKGSGAIESLGAGAAVAAGRAGFASLNLVANTLNGTINLLTGGILDLRTDLALLPNSLRTNAEQLSILQGRAKDAEENLLHLQSLGGQFGKEVWYQNEVERARAVAAEYRAALAQKQALMGIGGLTTAYTEGMGNNKTIVRQREAEAAAEKALTDVRMRAAGINKQYFTDLKTYQDALKLGTIDQATYAKEVSDLAKRTWDASAAGKELAKAGKEGASAAKAEQSEYARLMASITGKIQQSKEELKYGHQLNDAEKLRIMLLAQLETGTKKLTAAHAARANAALQEFDETEKQLKAKGLIDGLTQQLEKAQQRNAYEQLFFDIQKNSLKLSDEQLNKALGLATIIDMAKELEEQRAAQLNLQNSRYALQNQLIAEGKSYLADIDSYGLGDKAAREMRQRAQIQTQAAAELAKLEQARQSSVFAKPEDAGKINAVYAEQSKDLQQALQTRLSMYDDYLSLVRQKEGDWRAGAASGVQTYLESARDVYSQMQGVVTNAFRGMEDSLTSFVMTGKLDFKSLANSVIADILRMQIRAQMSGLFGNLFGSIGLSSLGSAGIGVSASSVANTGISFDSGGYTGPGGKYELAGYVHKGEGVLSQRDMRALGGPAAFERLRRDLHAPRGYADGGVVGRSPVVPAVQSAPIKTGPTIIVQPTINIDSSTDKGQVKALVIQGMNIAIKQAQAELLDKMSRGMA